MNVTVRTVLRRINSRYRRLRPGRRVSTRSIKAQNGREICRLFYLVDERHGGRVLRKFADFQEMARYYGRWFPGVV